MDLNPAVSFQELQLCPAGTCCRQDEDKRALGAEKGIRGHGAVAADA